MDYKKLSEVETVGIEEVGYANVLATVTTAENTRSVVQMPASALVPDVPYLFSAVYNDTAHTVTVTDTAFVRVFSYELNVQGKITSISLSSITPVPNGGISE